MIKKKIPIKEISLDLGTTALSRYNFTDGVEFLKGSYKNDKDVFNYSRSNDDEFLKNLVPVLMGSVVDSRFEDFYPYPIRSNISYTVELDDQTDGISIDVITQHVTGDALPIDSIYFPILKNFTFPSNSGKILQLTGLFGSINGIMIIDGQHDGVVSNLIIRVGGIEIINVKPEFATQKNGLRFSDIFTLKKIRNDKNVHVVVDNDIDLIGKNVDVELPYAPKNKTSVVTTGHAYFNGKVFADRNYDARKTVDFVAFNKNSAVVIRDV